MARQRKLWLVLGAVIVIAAGTYYWLFVQSPALAGKFDIDMAQVRQLASSIAGELPRDIRYEHVMDFTGPGAATVTGDSWKESTLWGVAFQFVYSGHTAILETTMNAAQAKASGMVTGYYEDAYQRVLHAMSKASLILVTHEHPDHMGGLVAHPDLGRLLGTSVKLNKQQTVPNRFSAVFPPGVLRNYKSLDYQRYLAIAPGIVLIRDPGHTAGSQMVFVRKADGTELLFLGDVAWIHRNVELVRGKPRFISNKVGEDREAVLPQLVAVHALAEAEPKLIIVPGHDAGMLKELTQRAIMKAGFE